MAIETCIWLLILQLDSHLGRLGLKNNEQNISTSSGAHFVVLTCSCYQVQYILVDKPPRLLKTDCILSSKPRYSILCDFCITTAYTYILSRILFVAKHQLSEYTNSAKHLYIYICRGAKDTCVCLCKHHIHTQPDRQREEIIGLRRLVCCPFPFGMRDDCIVCAPMCIHA